MKKTSFLFLSLLLVMTTLGSLKVKAQQEPTLTEVWCDFETYDGGNDKDNDSKIELSYAVKYTNGISRVFAIAPMEAHGRFPDGSSNKVVMKQQGSPKLKDITDNPGTFTIKFEPKGDDTWKFHYVLRMKFSDGTLLDVQSGRFAELSDQKRQLP